MKKSLLGIDEPEDYFCGIGNSSLPTPKNLLLFVRHSQGRLQQEALHNRSHHRFVLVFNLKTEGVVHVDHLALSFKPGQALLILPFQFHHFSQLASPKVEWIFCTFELDADQYLQPLRNRVIDADDKIRKVLEGLLVEWHSPRTEMQAQQLQACLLQLLLSLKESCLRRAADLPPEPTENLLRTVNQLMAEWRGRTVVVADLAKAIGYSESRLRILFKERAGIALGAYMQNYKINRAMALLRTTDLLIADVAEDAGFGSPQAFSRIFREKTGQTPRVYRNQG